MCVVINENVVGGYELGSVVMFCGKEWLRNYKFDGVSLVPEHFWLTFVSRTQVCLYSRE